jgi:hypothetical protein
MDSNRKSEFHHRPDRDRRGRCVTGTVCAGRRWRDCDGWGGYCLGNVGEGWKYMDA